jgi:hypothetical protein
MSIDPAFAPVRFRARILAVHAAMAFGLLTPGVASAEDVQIKDRIEVAPVWAGHPVGFALLTEGKTQYVAYYDDQRRMTVASRALDSKTWTKVVLPSSVEWDSHNYITLALDRSDQLHVVGNLHVSPLVYFRTKTAGDITSLAPVARMTGQRENRMTYPTFIKGDGGELIFHYRDGESGNGATLYNRYNEKTMTWSRLMDRPLFDGDEKMNAYPIGPLRGPDDYWHMTWVWRDTRDAETNHDLSYARSKNLLNWETVAGKPVGLPISIKTPGVILDPVPVNGGIINGTGKIGFDDQKRVVVAYHKFDEQGATQVYLARAANEAWKIHQLTDWSHRWEPKGPGSIPFDVGHSALRSDPRLGLFITLDNAKHGRGIWKIDPATLRLKDSLNAGQLPDYVPGSLYHAHGDGMRTTIARDAGTPPPGRRYVLRWETLPLNRDRPQSGPLPEPSMLELVVLEDPKSR